MRGRSGRDTSSLGLTGHEWSGGERYGWPSQIMGECVREVMECTEREGAAASHLPLRVTLHGRALCATE